MKRRYWHIGPFAIIVGLGVYLLGCCEKKIIQPEEPKDYYVYFGDEVAPNTFYRYNTGTQILDSFYLPYNSLLDGIGISPDGKTMYLHPDNGIVEVSLDSLVVVAEHPIYLPKNGSTGSGHEVIVSPDGHYLALLNRYLHLVDLTNYSVVFSDTNGLMGNGWFAQNSESFYCIKPGETEYLLIEIKFGNDFEVIYHSYGNGYVYGCRTSPDNRLWFLSLAIGSGYGLFQVYDVIGDSIIFGKGMCPEVGDMAITPNGRYVVYTQPAAFGISCPPVMTFTIYDVAGNRIDREVVAFFDSLQAVSDVDQIAITPDGRHLIGLGWHAGHLLDYDLLTHEFKKILVFQGGIVRLVHSLSCQSRL